MEEHGYTVIRALGQGGVSSRVYEVRDREGRLRVLKQLPWVREEERESATQEVKLLSSLRHPCIVPYLESFLVRSTPSMPSEDILCLVMSRCERDLRQACLRRRLECELDREEEYPISGTLAYSKQSAGARFEESQILSWLVQLCWGLQHLHSRKFLHRDLKPQNVLLTHGGRRAMLADFGVAGQGDHTEDLRRSIVGTPAFMSPEMLEGRPYGLKTDQWALGCILFEMMALEPPFANCGESYAGVVSAVLHAPRMCAPVGYGPELGNIMEALLAKKPHDRPSNRELLRGALLRGPFHAFVQSLEQAASAAAAANVERAANPEPRRGGLGDAPAGPLDPPPLLRGESETSETVSEIPTVMATPLHTAAPTTAAGSPWLTARGWTPIETPSEVASPAPRRGPKCAVVFASNVSHSTVGISGVLVDCDTLTPHGDGDGAQLRYGLPPPAVETDVASYTSDFDTPSLSGDSPTAAAAKGAVQADGGALSAHNRPGGESFSLSIRSELSLSSAGHTGSGSETVDALGLGTCEWRQLLAEAETLLQEAPGTAGSEAAEHEMRKVRAALCDALGTSCKVDQALSFMRERRPLGDTIEADELLLQVELLDLLGDEGLHALPLLERLLALETAAVGGTPLGAANTVARTAASPIEESQLLA
mmetsp:Transcript_124563/g.240351  ORF Transcript_124563/g.240351 Transcript_124563/m.240351 type:complete len:653 (-) Transcript_124563:7-1965(-)